MNLLVVTEFLREPGCNGSEVACRALIRALRRRHRVDVVARADDEPCTGEVAFPVDEPTRSEPERLERFLEERIDLSAYDLVYNLGALSFGCDVVTCLRPWEALVPLVNHFQVLLGPYARAEMRPAPRQREHAAGQMAVAARAAMNVFVSQEEHRAALGYGYDLSAGGVAVIPNGLPLAEFEGIEPDDSFLPPALRGAGRRPLVIAAAGRFSDYAKGADLLYRAFARLYRQRQDLFLVVLANKDRFAYLLRDLPADSYALAGWQPRPRFLRLLAAADLVVVPSRYEPFGLVALEAHLLGRPVVANAVGGLSEIVHHGESGLLNPPAGGSLGLYLALARMAADPVRLRAMGERGKRHAQREYALERVYGFVEQALERARLPKVVEGWVEEAAS